jgi:hypothetical protein
MITCKNTLGVCYAEATWQCTDCLQWFCQFHKVHSCSKAVSPTSEMNRTAVAPKDDAILLQIRSSLKARLEGRNEGGDSVIMKLVDDIVKKEAAQKQSRASRSIFPRKRQ